MWAIGCLLAEMLTGEPLFPGDSDIDQLHHITRCFGMYEKTSACTNNICFHREFNSASQRDFYAKSFIRGSQTSRY